MKRRSGRYLCCLFIFLGLNLSAQNKLILSPSGLRTDLVKSEGPPALIGSNKPMLNWEINDSGYDVVQTAYQVLVANNKGFSNAWSSGKANSRSSSILYNGAALWPNKTYYWKVRVWDNRGHISRYSKIASFSTGQELTAYQTPVHPLQITEVKPVRVNKVGSIYHVDFGKDAFGRLKLNLTANSERDSAVIRLGEVLSPDGSINRHPPGTIRYSIYVIRLAKGDHTYTLQVKKDKINTQHSAIKMTGDIGEVTPFRYVEIEGNASQVIQLSVHYPFDDEAASFNSSDTTLNAVWELCKYTMKATSFTGYFIDGDRERTPYEADAYINQLSDYAVNDDYTLARRSGEYLMIHPTWPTEWILQSVLIAWNDYLYTGDSRSVAQYYDDLKAKSLMALEDSTKLISTRNGKVTDAVIASVHFNDKLKDIVDWPQKTESDGFVFTPYNAVVNAFYYRNLILLCRLATILNKKQDAAFFEEKARIVRQVYHKAFFDPVRKIYVDGIGTEHASLHANLFSLEFGLANDNQKKNILSFIRSKGMACSVYGAQFLLDAVYDAGDDDYGLSLLTSHSDRSWYNMIQAGSTITTEAWDNKYKPNQDWNHAWGAAAANIISRKLMGIEPLTPGWETFSIKPEIGRLRFARIIVPSIKGRITADYTQSQHTFKARLLIPANTKAKFLVPIRRGRKVKIWKDGRLINTHFDSEWLGSGLHFISIQYTQP